MHELGASFKLTGSTGTMAAALAANSIVFAMQAIDNAAVGTSQGQRRGPVVVDNLRVSFTAIVGSAAALLAGRALQLFKGSGSHPLGGTALTPIAARGLDVGSDSGLVTSPRIAASASLTVVGFTRGTVPIATFDLSGSGALGAQATRDFDWRTNSEPIYLDPGELLVLSNPAIFDLLLTWQLTVDVNYRRREAL